MLNICLNCGLYRPDKIIDPAGPYAICPECGHRYPFLRLPLFIVSGASGTGKSTVCQYLVGKLTEVVVLDSDILWRPEFQSTRAGAPNFCEIWLRVAKNVGQSGRPVLLFGSGMGVPDNIERCVERRYFEDVHYLALVCSDDVLAGRLRDRPKWRESHSPEYVSRQMAFNQWFKTRNRDLTPAIELLDTTSCPISFTAQRLTAWIKEIAEVRQE
jgi:AAA domain